MKKYLGLYPFIIAGILAFSFLYSVNIFRFKELVFGYITGKYYLTKEDVPVIITWFQVVITGLFSYLLWKATLKNIDLQKRIEDDRSNEAKIAKDYKDRETKKINFNYAFSKGSEIQFCLYNVNNIIKSLDLRDYCVLNSLTLNPSLERILILDLAEFHTFCEKEIFVALSQKLLEAKSDAFNIINIKSKTNQTLMDGSENQKKIEELLQNIRLKLGELIGDINSILETI